MAAAVAAAARPPRRDGVLAGLEAHQSEASGCPPGEIDAPNTRMRATWRPSLYGAGRSLVTLAPECVPAGFVRKLAAAGVRMSIGHSEAPAAVVMQAVADGATGVTHLFNAMPPLSAREPGIIGAALAEPRLTAGLIVDGIMRSGVEYRAAFAAKGADRIALVSDAMPTVGTWLPAARAHGSHHHSGERAADHGGRRAPGHGLGGTRCNCCTWRTRCAPRR